MRVEIYYSLAVLCALRIFVKTKAGHAALTIYGEFQ
jgi:hypothetical protein